MEVEHADAFDRGLADRARKAYGHYISKYRELGLPSAPDFADVLRRMKEVETDW